MSALSLSIVIIARNEAANIARAIESVLQATKEYPQAEVLLVDSASTDNTVEVAGQYPINIVRLPSAWFKSVAAGRYIGMHYSRGELVLHMDGDMELTPDWVNQSVSYMLAHPKVAAVGGYWRNIYIQGEHIFGEEDNYHDPQGRIREELYVGGASLYRRSVIEATGGFQPFIRGEEDVELCMRMRYAGYKIIRLPVMMSRHYCIPLESQAGLLRRLRLNLWLGFGQVPRYYFGTPLFWMYLKERGTYLVYFLGILISILTLLLTIFTDNLIYFSAWLLIAAAVLILFWIKKRSLTETIMSVIHQTFVAYSAIRGFLIPPRPSTEYPTDAEIVQVRYHLGGMT